MWKTVRGSASLDSPGLEGQTLGDTRLGCLQLIRYQETWEPNPKLAEQWRIWRGDLPGNFFLVVDSGGGARTYSRELCDRQEKNPRFQ